MAGELAFTAAANAGSAAFVGPPDSSIHTKLKLPADTGAAGKMLAVKSANHSSTNAELEWTTVSGGISEADQWRLTTTFASGGTIITSNWERVDARGSAGPLSSASGVGQSSGVFTLPSNGYWYVEFRTTCAGTDCDWVFTKILTESSSYNPVAYNRSACKDADSYAYVGSQCLLDVTDHANQKLKFEVGAQYSIDWYGDSDYSDTSVMFIKLGDT